MDMNRRDFLRTSAFAAATLAVPQGVFAQSTSQLKVGVIGFGGRGTGAASDALTADPGVVIWSVGDLYQDRIDNSAKYIAENFKGRYLATADRTFSGLDAYKGVIASGVDVVILATPPGYRPTHFEAAVAANKHVFIEKPVAVDAEGVRRMLTAAVDSEAKGLQVVAGTQRRHDPAYRETIKRIRDGQMGDVTACYAYWNQGSLWMNARQPNWSDFDWQLRNWLYFTCLSGDIIVEQHIHNIDVCNWVMNAFPIKAISLGGRQVRTDAAYGHVYDHFATEFEYANGVKMISMCRQQDGCANRVAEHIVGTKGTSNASSVIRGESAFRYDGPRPNPYVEEHRHLIAAIRGGEKINEARQVTETTLSAIMGREAAYTGAEITRDMMLASTTTYPLPSPAGSVPVAPVAMPGKTKFA